MMSRLWVRLRWPLVFLGLALVWLLPLMARPDGFPLWVGGGYSDLLVSHWPNAHWLRRSLVEWGQIPLWNPQILSGAPFASDPLSGLWYPPVWLAPWLPGALGFNLLFLIHLAWAGLGAARLARDGGVGWAGAAVAGIVYSGTPKLIGHIGLGHLGLVCAASWTPWVLVAARRALEPAVDDPRSRRKAAALAGAALGAAFLADPRWAAPTGLLLLVYAAFVMMRAPARPAGWGRQVSGRLLILGLSAAGIAAALALPLLSMVPLTTRAVLTGADRAALSLSPAALLGLLVPDLGGWAERLAFAGVGALFLAVAALLTRARGAWFWAGVVLVGWVLALGDHTPLYTLLARLPGFDLLRVPARFLLISVLALACLAGLGLDALLSGLADRHQVALRLGFVAAGGVCLLLGLAGASIVGRDAAGFWGTAVLGVLAAGVGWASLSRRVSARMWSAAWLLLVVGELAWVDSSLLTVRSASESLGARGALIRSMVASLEPGQRAFSPSYSLPQQAASAAGVELADGVNPLQLTAYVQAMRQAVGIEDTGYSVTLAPFPSGDPAVSWGAEIDAERLGRFSVALVAAEYPLSSPGLEEVSEDEGVWVYRNLRVRPRAWLQDTEEVASTWSRVDAWEWSPNRIQATARGPGVVVFSEVVFPGWQATVDGEPAPLLVIDGVLRGVRIDSGAHIVILAFRPLPVFVGAAWSLLTVLAILVWRMRA